MNTRRPRYLRHRFPPEIISHAVWLYHRYCMSFRDVEDLLGCFRHQLLLPRPYLVLTKPLRLDIQCQRGASVKIGWKYLEVSG